MCILHVFTSRLVISARSDRFAYCEKLVYKLNFVLQSNLWLDRQTTCVANLVVVSVNRSRLVLSSNTMRSKNLSNAAKIHPFSANEFAKQRLQWRIQDFSEGSAPTPRSPIIFQFFCRKLHENERIWTLRWISQWSHMRNSVFNLKKHNPRKVLAWISFY